MPGTNFTDNYELPLYAPTDYYDPMGTHNDAMDKIDNALVNVQEDAAQAIYLARQAASNFADIPQMQQQIKDNTDHIDIVERKLSTVTGTIMALVKSVDGYNDEFTQVNFDMETIRGQMDDINNSQAAINKDIAANTADIVTLKSGVSTVSEEINDINNTISDNNTTINNLNIKVTQQGTNIAAIQAKDAEQDSSIDQLETDVAGLKADMPDVSLQDMADSVSRLDKTVYGDSTSTPPLEGLTAEVSTLEAEQATTDQRLNALETDVNGLKTDMPNVSLQDIADTVQKIDNTVYADQTGLVDRVAALEKDISGDATTEPPTTGIADRVTTLENEQIAIDGRLDTLENNPGTGIQLKMVYNSGNINMEEYTTVPTNATVNKTTDFLGTVYNVTVPPAGSGNTGVVSLTFDHELPDNFVGVNAHVPGYTYNNIYAASAILQQDNKKIYRRHVSIINNTASAINVAVGTYLYKTWQTWEIVEE